MATPKKAQDYYGVEALEIGDRLRRWRLEKNISLGEMQALTGLSSTTYRGWEQGTIPNVLYLTWALRALGHTVDELMDGIGLEGPMAKRGGGDGSDS